MMEAESTSGMLGVSTDIGKCPRMWFTLMTSRASD
jgi:hypothetical protein